MNKKLVSVIIPVYNVEEYVEACVESVLKQIYQELEIILVDDGSTDKSGMLCDEYTKKDDRIKVFHKENGGLSDARNSGLKISKGEYVYFLDSDDLIDENAINLLVESCELHGAEIGVAPLIEFDYKVPTIQVGNDSAIVLTAVDAIRKMFLRQGLSHSACGKLYKRTLWNEVEFPFGKLYEDYATIYKVFVKCNKVTLLDTPTYFYRTRTGSIMNHKIGKKELQIIEVSEEVTNYIAQTICEVKEEAEYLQMVTYLKTLKRILDVGLCAYPEEQKTIISFVCEKKYLINKEWSNTADRIKVRALMVGKVPFYIVYSLGECFNRLKKNK